MGLFGKKRQTQAKTWDKENKIPVIRASICTGEQVAGFKNIHTGHFEDVMLLQSSTDLETFRRLYGIEGEIKTIY